MIYLTEIVTNENSIVLYQYYMNQISCSRFLPVYGLFD